MPIRKERNYNKKSPDATKNKSSGKMPPASADPTSMVESCKIHQGTGQRDLICPKTNNRHGKYRKHEKDERTAKEIIRAKTGTEEEP